MKHSKGIDQADIERVARAICKGQERNWDALDYLDPQQVKYMEYARAAIQAMQRAEGTNYLGFAVENLVWRGTRATIVDRDFPIGTPITVAKRIGTAMGSNPPPRFRHKKRGSVYHQIALASLQCTEACSETAVLVIYRGEDGKVWARPHDEFHDGRFEAVGTKELTGERITPSAERIDELERAVGASVISTWLDMTMNGLRFEDMEANSASAMIFSAGGFDPTRDDIVAFRNDYMARFAPSDHQGNDT